jgi:hypothetical protein
MWVTGSGAATISMSGERALNFVASKVLVYAFDKGSSPKGRLAAHPETRRGGSKRHAVVRGDVRLSLIGEFQSQSSRNYWRYWLRRSV